MAIHQADRRSNNPRLQCSCCGQWKRLIGMKVDEETGKREQFYRFFGGCGYTNGDHLAAKTADTNDVCDDCCQTECKRLFEASACKKYEAQDGYMHCDKCKSIWSPLQRDLGWLPSRCPSLKSPQETP